MTPPKKGNNGSRKKETLLNEESDEFVYAAVEKFFQQLGLKATGGSPQNPEAKSNDAESNETESGSAASHKVNTRQAAEELSKQFG